MTLTRNGFFSTGIFGTLDADDESLSLQTLEHAFNVGEPGVSTFYQPAVPPGVYTCQRGTHVLEPTPLVPNPQPFETFQLLTVPGHSKILIHVGNTNSDSIGCILVGLFRSGNDSIMQSRTGFKLFMDLQDGINEFILTVI